VLLFCRGKGFRGSNNCVTERDRKAEEEEEEAEAEAEAGAGAGAGAEGINRWTPRGGDTGLTL
jgi:hypothetical protein